MLFTSGSAHEVPSVPTVVQAVILLPQEPRFLSGDFVFQLSNVPYLVRKIKYLLIVVHSFAKSWACAYDPLDEYIC